ncbi:MULTISPECIES: extracellular solute-binding protein [unclassified Streptomyces]|uniref:extracellular solute-binding protein n=1 Tax=unclassified Streptomyces TaxID=2593676 RepID=UPI000DC7E75B|nr:MULTISPECIES: extracellular solute-binding protein [unclassified Streptomyces]AWZ10590.1 sugar transporter [Streptomyces sp. ICC4]AWZ18508.1 sugar transporter [Streptomyces sp. ICC1]
MKIRFLAVSTALVAATALAGCSLAGSAGGPQKVTLWLMKGSASDEFIAQFTSSYEADHPDIDLDVKIQEWTGIGDKVNAVLSGKSTEGADVIEVGNTQVAQYVETGGVSELTLEALRLWDGKDWLKGLSDPGSVNGAQFGVPWYAANRVVIYNKDLFANAGIKTPVKTRAEWIQATQKLDKGSQQGIYLAGQNWYVLAGFIWDEGGELAVEGGGQWLGTLDDEKALAGMEFYKQLQDLGNGPKDADEETPPQSEVFARGGIAQIIAPPGQVAAIEAANPALKGKLGFFPIPGKTADKVGSVFTGGSDLIIPESTKRRKDAVDVVTALVSEKWQTELARTMSYVPNKTTLAHVVEGNEGATAMAPGAAQGRATPKSARWAEVEAKNPIKPFMTAVLTGQDPKEAAKTASDTISKVLSSDR